METKYKYGFVVLNYNNYQDTIECIQSILSIKRSDYIIVIVDNYSKNESVRRLNTYFDENKIISIIVSSHNLGYSGGNNLGIEYLKSKGIDWVIIATSDTILLSLNIIEAIECEDWSGCGVIGPRIVTWLNLEQNPSCFKLSLLYIFNLYFPGFMESIRNFIYMKFPFFKSLRAKYVLRKKVVNKDKIKCTVYALHGSFFILCPEFIKKIGKLDDNIFMFCEEDLIAWQCEENNLKRIYYSAIQVLHKDDRSLDFSFKEEKNKFVNDCTKESLRYLKKRIPFYKIFLKFLI